MTFFFSFLFSLQPVTFPHFITFCWKLLQQHQKHSESAPKVAYFCSFLSHLCWLLLKNKTKQTTTTTTTRAHKLKEWYHVKQTVPSVPYIWKFTLYLLWPHETVLQTSATSATNGQNREVANLHFRVFVFCFRADRLTTTLWIVKRIVPCDFFLYIPIGYISLCVDFTFCLNILHCGAYRRDGIVKFQTWPQKLHTSQFLSSLASETGLLLNN